MIFKNTKIIPEMQFTSKKVKRTGFYDRHVLKIYPSPVLTPKISMLVIYIGSVMTMVSRHRVWLS